MLKKLMEETREKGGVNLKSGLRKAGIFPLGRTQVLARLPWSSADAEVICESFMEYLAGLCGSASTTPKARRN